MTDTAPSTHWLKQHLRSRLITPPHAMFNRHGGKSIKPFSTLNVSYRVGDDPGIVAANRKHIKNILGTPFLLSAHQIHSDKIFYASDISADTEVEGYDALITNQPGVGLLVQQADCQAILIHDPQYQVIAAIHCGWRGSALNIIGKTIAKMQHRYHSDPAALTVAISPSLGSCCAEFINYRKELPVQLHQFQERVNHFNFWDISISQLVATGISKNKIDAARICTACNRDYFSYRRTKKRGELTTGRNGSAICLPAK